MGIVRQYIRLSNFALPEHDEIDALALVDTGSPELCIPQHVANQFRLRVIDEREVRLADGLRKTVPSVGGMKVEGFGRKTVTSANVLGDEVPLGAIPVKAMELIVHSTRPSTAPNPDSPRIPASLAKGAWNG